MSRIIALGWAAALTVGLIAADLPAQRARPEGPSISRRSSPTRRGRAGRAAAGRASSATSTK